jgi:hypothetical protein
MSASDVVFFPMMWQAFLNFQSEQSGVVTAEDAAQIAKTTRASIYMWAERRCVKKFIHRGKVYIGMDSLRQLVLLRPLVLGHERERRRRFIANHRKRVVDSRKVLKM